MVAGAEGRRLRAEVRREQRRLANERHQVIGHLQPTLRGLGRPFRHFMYEDSAWPLPIDTLPHGNHGLPDAVSYLLGNAAYGAQPSISVGHKVT